MFNNTRKSSGGGYKGRGGNGGGDWKRDGQSGGGRPDMHRATCVECRANCEVPFKPNGKKPVLCSDCFRKDDGGRPNFEKSDRYDRPERSDRYEKPIFRSAAPSGDNGEVVKQLKALNDKMDQLLGAIANMEQ